MHRQKISSQYSISVETKKYVKYSIYMHFMTATLIVVQLSFYYANELVFIDPNEFQLPEVPKPQLWQFIWLTSLIPSICGYFSLYRNTLSLMKFYYYGSVVLGLGSCLFTMILNASDLMDFASNHEATNKFNEFPIIVIWFAYLFVVIQIHAFGIYFSRVLIQIWSKDSKKKK